MVSCIFTDRSHRQSPQEIEQLLHDDVQARELGRLKTCAYPPRFREAWFYAFGKRKNEANNIELLAFASRFSDAELSIGFNTKYFGRGRVAGANYTELASREFWVRRGEEDYVRSLPVQQDHHRHTLVVRFPLNATDGSEVVRIRVGKEGAEKWLRLSEVEVCDERMIGGTLALCTSVLGKDLTGHPDHVVVWLGYHFAQGVDKATVYVDVSPELCGNQPPRYRASMANAV